MITTLSRDSGAGSPPPITPAVARAIARVYARRDELAQMLAMRFPSHPDDRLEEAADAACSRLAEMIWRGEFSPCHGTWRYLERHAVGGVMQRRNRSAGMVSAAAHSDYLMSEHSLVAAAGDPFRERMATGRAADVAAAVGTLTPRQQEIAYAVGYAGTVLGASRALGLSRSTVLGQIAAVRAHVLAKVDGDTSALEALRAKRASSASARPEYRRQRYAARQLASGAC